jgi:hypothetical protein
VNAPVVRHKVTFLYKTHRSPGFSGFSLCVCQKCANFELFLFESKEDRCRQILGTLSCNLHTQSWQSIILISSSAESNPESRLGACARNAMVNA